MSGKSTYIQPAIEDLYSKVQVSTIRLGFYKILPEQFVPHYGYPVRTATEDDVPLLVELYRNYEFYGRNIIDEEIEHEIQRVMDESGVYFFIEWQGQAVSAARIAAETDRAGIIDAARTLPEFRGHGMYPCVRTACVEYLFKREKIGLALVRDTNTSMNRIISKCGDSLTDTWLIVHLRKKHPLRRRILPARLRRWGLSIKDKVWGK